MPTSTWRAPEQQKANNNIDRQYMRGIVRYMYGRTHARRSSPTAGPPTICGIRRSVDASIRRSDLRPEGEGVLLERTIASPGCRASPRTLEVGQRFGVSAGPTEIVIAAGVRVRLGPGRVVLLLGPSGSGKTSALRTLLEANCQARMVGRTTFPPDVAIIDRIASSGSFADAVAALTACGLGDAHLWVRPFPALSEGEQFRARLARTVADHAAGPADTAIAPILCDEFCAGLHRWAAKAVSHNLRKLATRRGLCLVLAAGNDDIVYDLQPDTIVRFSGDGSARVEDRPTPVHRSLSVLRTLRIEPGAKRDYDTFAKMHYRATDELGFVDKVFVLREPRGDLFGIVVYSHPPMELSLRNRATQGRFSRNPTALNRGVRILRRLVIHPELRGCGAGHFLVRRTLPLVGTEFVECLAAMGAFNPVFEKAGMDRIGQYEQSESCRRAIAELAAIGVHPDAADFAAQVHRQPRVRRIVARVVYNWYQATTGGGENRVARQSPEFLAQTFRGLIGSRPVYYLWRRLATARKRRTPVRTPRGRSRRSDPRFGPTQTRTRESLRRGRRCRQGRRRRSAKSPE